MSVSLYVRTCPLVREHSILPGLVSGNIRKPNDIQTFLSTWCFIVYKQDLGKTLQAAGLNDSLVLETASRAEHAQLGMRWYLLCSHRGTGLLTRMPQPISALWHRKQEIKLEVFTRIEIC